jgi:integrase
MRSGELLSLTWRDVDLTRGLVALHDTKNGERRAIPITGYALELLREYGQRRGHTDILFPNDTGTRPRSIRRAWEHAIRRAGIDDFRFHDLRHSAASYLAMNGASLMEIAEILGHKTLSMVKRYAHLSEPHTRNVIERMNRAVFESR